MDPGPPELCPPRRDQVGLDHHRRPPVVHPEDVPPVLGQQPPAPSFFFSSRRRHTSCTGDWSSDVCSSDLHLPSCATACWKPCGSTRRIGSSNPVLRMLPGVGISPIFSPSPNVLVPISTLARRKAG